MQYPTSQRAQWQKRNRLRPIDRISSWEPTPRHPIIVRAPAFPRGPPASLSYLQPFPLIPPALLSSCRLLPSPFIIISSPLLCTNTSPVTSFTTVKALSAVAVS
ncbi:uncharacterized protein BJ212DRAFT_549318 [Suillus subaureus]|uniref:Uncharacterized protein n=1 Tax=Suillus subaureus TaxID=48587 RepID=A0A9P7JJ22_9AGAM|nr:uncharacterized protein BJ212DRAFT_549318 [Suillus subaureus]KAG1824834.1 hypothetical protein BJ212DRAFT_549318 [Suillus subaureus]